MISNIINEYFCAADEVTSSRLPKFIFLKLNYVMSHELL